MAKKDVEKKIKAYLLNQKIVSIRYMSKQQATELISYTEVAGKVGWWHGRPIQIKLSNGVWLTLSVANGIQTNIKELPIIPVMNY
jgi:hypothetical protein